MKSTLAALTAGCAILAPTLLFFDNLPFTVSHNSLREVEVAYDGQDPLVIDLHKSKISFTEYNRTVTQSRSQLRRSLQEYLEPRLFIHHRTP